MKQYFLLYNLCLIQCNCIVIFIKSKQNTFLNDEVIPSCHYLMYGACNNKLTLNEWEF